MAAYLYYKDKKIIRINRQFWKMFTMKKIFIQNNFSWYCLPVCIMLWAQSFAQPPVVVNATDFGVKANSYEMPRRRCDER
jgi:hypothetical protein